MGASEWGSADAIVGTTPARPAPPDPAPDVSSGALASSAGRYQMVSVDHDPFDGLIGDTSGARNLLTSGQPLPGSDSGQTGISAGPKPPPLRDIHDVDQATLQAASARVSSKGIPPPFGGPDPLEAAGRLAAPNLTSYLVDAPPQYKPITLPDGTRMLPRAAYDQFSDPRFWAAAGDVALLGSSFVAPELAALERVAGAVPTVGRAVSRTAPIAEDAVALANEPHIYKPPNLPQRPFEADYPPSRWPNGPPVDATGRLTHDIDGRPLTAPFIVGRRYAGQPDTPLTAADIADIGRQLTGQPLVGRRLPPQQYGSYTTSRQPGGGRSDRWIRYSTDIPPPIQDRVIAHEVGHAMEHEIVGDAHWFAGRGLDPTRYQDDLRSIYNDLNNPARNMVGVPAWNGPGNPSPANIMSPERHGYRANKVKRELWAEVNRAILGNPNYVKSTAPDLAEAMRATINSDPWLSKIVQFNAIPLAAGALVAGAGTGDVKAAPVDRDPFVEGQ
jgi:hypothetical protein